MSTQTTQRKNFVKVYYAYSRENEFTRGLNCSSILSIDSNTTLNSMKKVIKELFQSFVGKGCCTITDISAGPYLELIEKFENVYKKHFINKTYKFNNK